jgi:hypothetical protein
VSGKGKLADIVDTWAAPRGFTSCLHCRQEQRNQDTDDGDDDEQLDECKSGSVSMGGRFHSMILP